MGGSAVLCSVIPTAGPRSGAIIPSAGPEPLRPPGTGLRHRLALLRSGTRLAIAGGSSLLTAVALPTSTMWQLRAVAAWDGFALPALALIWLTILTLRPAQIRQVAQREDPGRMIALVLVVLGAGVALLAVVVLIKSSEQMDVAQRRLGIALALPAVVMAWALTHTVFTLRYAHLFHGDVGARPGLIFPDEEDIHLDYLDFAYYSFTIGMAAQTADVAVRSRQLRRLTLLHAVISFAFNTALIALSISALTNLLD